MREAKHSRQEILRKCRYRREFTCREQHEKKKTLKHTKQNDLLTAKRLFSSITTGSISGSSNSTSSRFWRGLVGS